ETDRSEAERRLISFLEDQGGSAAAKEIKRASASDGLEWRTMQRASTRVAHTANSGFQGAWLWTLDLTKGDSKATKATSLQNPVIFVTFVDNVTPLHPEALS
ncbi:hypothetical protein, partial [Kitasatospora herbaricolor]|uniref:hypothetical protein n=1 Tax=Kitasatospora herbaricolor TaxID=68217 RepID=UPI0036DD272B